MHVSVSETRRAQLQRTSKILQVLLDHQDSILTALQRPAVEDAVPVEPEHQRYCSP